MFVLGMVCMTLFALGMPLAWAFLVFVLLLVGIITLMSYVNSWTTGRLRWYYTKSFLPRRDLPSRNPAIAPLMSSSRRDNQYGTFTPTDDAV